MTVKELFYQVFFIRSPWEIIRPSRDQVLYQKGQPATLLLPVPLIPAASYPVINGVPDNWRH